MNYWNAYQAWKKKDWATPQGSVNRFKVPLSQMYKDVEDMYQEKYGTTGDFGIWNREMDSTQFGEYLFQIIMISCDPFWKLKN